MVCTVLFTLERPEAPNRGVVVAFTTKVHVFKVGSCISEGNVISHY